MNPAIEITLSVAWLGLMIALATWMRADTPMPSWWGF